MHAPGQQPLIERDAFVNLDADAYLYTGAHSPALRRVEEAIVCSYRAKSLGEGGRDVLYAAEAATRASIARLTDRPVEEVGLLGDASSAWSAIANGWQWSPGDNVVVNEYEHPAVFAPWLRLREAGLEVRVVPRRADWSLPVEDLVAACDDRTVALCVSHVGYITGLRYDLEELGMAAENARVPLLLDISHSLGVVPTDLSRAALTVSASYKWTLGPYGVGIVFWNRDILPDFKPGAVGWRSLSNIFTEDRFETLNWNPGASRFQVGAPALAEIAGLGAAIDEILELGIDRVEAHAVSLAAAAAAGLREQGFTVITPADPAAHAGNVSFLWPNGEQLAAALAEQGVYVWGGDGRVRASFHVMNDTGDVERFLSAVRAATVQSDRSHGLPTPLEGSTR
ncbi:aminotransferase class V-fold PLP-dependent enzyme [Leucobacter aridicollis]|uniref:aminotransferase class V-fold PLP-dependent enzyme n=1 Tax=Leucobacter aridicollis TaxID=283878 RepID=UPI000E650935|nr:aminotransferase class V-fold PLP-dependent enzyme [Leucobacter aridicollis]UTX52655.1 aminotransferase class V-fold PLP-dependent enzyme [Leucobacter aridicollis]